MGIGDEVLAAGQAQRLYDADHSTRVAIFGQDRRPRWHPIWDGNPILATPSDVARGEPVRTVINGPNCRPYIVPPFTKETGWTFDTAFRCRDHVAKIYLTPHELQIGQRIRDEYGPYVLIEPHTKHDNFRWSMEQWAALVTACPGTTFVQHMHHDSPSLVPGAIDVWANFREACGLVASSLCYVRAESGMCHAAAALGIRQVTIFGGCMDPEVMGYYPQQTVIADRGEGSPCGRWLPCDHCQRIMAALSVETIAAAIRHRLATTADRLVA